MELINFIDYAGTFVFALSGVIAAVEQKFDLFGVFILGFVTAVGGGTLRDMMIGGTPVSWMQNETYVYLIMAAIPIVFFGMKIVLKFKRSFFIFDTLGIGLFTVLGMQKTLAVGLSPLIAVMMGVVSAVFGGIIRDVLANRTPLIFRKEIYAFACLAGALIYLGLTYLVREEIATTAAILMVIVIRILAIRFKWALPFNPRA